MSLQGGTMNQFEFLLVRWVFLVLFGRVENSLQRNKESGILSLWLHWVMCSTRRGNHGID
jgi:hypothetical protein